MRIFAGDRVRAIMERLKMPEGEPIEAGLVMRSIESAQRKVEARNFDIRKQLLEYDDVSNDQRKVIYQQRNELLASTDVSETINALRHSVLADVVRESVPEGTLEEQWDLAGLERVLVTEWHITPGFGEMSEKNDSLTDEDIVERVLERADAAYEAKLELAGREQLGGFARSVMLSSIDSHWREHPRSTRPSAVRAFICAASPRRIRSRSTSARLSNCLDCCSMRLAPKSRAP